MSSIYATEPATAGRVIFETTHGPLEVSLWCKECPGTTRLFLQHCLDGFYDDMVFHRIVPNFLIQTGALRQPAAAQNISEKSIQEYRTFTQANEALERRRYEVHSRLRFGHRGQLAMALGVEDDDSSSVADLQPQFFITLDEAPYLDGKHVLFGTISGPTIFNAIRIGNSEIQEGTNQPVDIELAPRIKSVKIVDNPLHIDLVPAVCVPWKAAGAETAKPKKKKKRKGVKNVNVLSFGDEMEDGDDLGGGGGGGIQSSHDVLDSKKLSKQVNKETAARARKDSSDEPVVSKRKRPRQQEDEPTVEVEHEPEIAPRVTYSKSKAKDDPTANNVPKVSTAAAPEKEPAPKKEKKMSIVEMRRAKYITGKSSKKKREDNTMAKLMAFQSKVKDQVGAAKGNAGANDNENSLASRMARRAEQGVESKEEEGPTYHGQVLESDDEDQEKTDWLGTRFKCRKHMDHGSREANLGGDGRSMNDYRVLDSRQGANDREDDRSEHKKDNKHHHRGRKDDHRRNHPKR